MSDIYYKGVKIEFTPPHQLHPERFGEFIDAVAELREKAGVPPISDATAAMAFDIIENAFPRT